MIRVLTEIGVSLKTIKDLATERSPELLMKLFSKQSRIVSDELKFLQEVFTVISAYLELLNEGVSAMESEISVQEMPDRQIILGDVNDYSGTDKFYREYMRFCTTSFEQKINLAYPIGGFFESMDDFMDEPSLPSRFFSLDPKGREMREKGLYLIGFTRGYYGRTNDLPDRLKCYAKKNGLIFCGPVYNLYLFDEMCLGDPEQYLLQVSAFVKETRRVSSRRPNRL